MSQSRYNEQGRLSALQEKTGRSEFRGGGVHLPGAAAGQVRRQLALGPLQYPKEAIVMGPPWENTKKEGGIPLCVGRILHSNGPGSSNLRVKNMGDLGGNGKEAGGSSRELPLKVTRERAQLKWYGTWNRERAASVIRETGTQTLGSSLTVGRPQWWSGWRCSQYTRCVKRRWFKMEGGGSVSPGGGKRRRGHI